MAKTGETEASLVLDLGLRVCLPPFFSLVEQENENFDNHKPKQMERRRNYKIIVIIIIIIIIN